MTKKRDDATGKVENLDETLEGRKDYPGGPREADFENYKEFRQEEKKASAKLPKQKLPTQEELDSIQPDKPMEPQKAKLDQAEKDAKEIRAEHKKHGFSATVKAGDKQTGSIELGQETEDRPLEPQKKKMEELHDLLKENPEFEKQSVRFDGAYDTFDDADPKKAETLKSAQEKHQEQVEKAAKAADKAESDRITKVLPKEHLPGFKTPAELKEEREKGKEDKVSVRMTIANNTVQQSFVTDLPASKVEFRQYVMGNFPDFINDAVNERMKTHDFPVEFQMQPVHTVIVAPEK